MNKSFITLLLLFSVLWSQAGHQINASIKTAKLLQKKGDIDGAVAIYQDILDKNPNHGQSIRDLKMLYKKNQRYEDGIQFLRSILVTQPENAQLYSELGEYHFLNGEVKEAKAVWSSGNEKFQRNRKWYRYMMTLYSRYGIDEDLIQLLENGRNIFGKSFMTYEAGNYYQTRRAYDKAMNQYILHLRFQPKQNGIIQRRILSMSDDIDAVDIIEKKLSTSAKANMTILNVLSEFYFKQQKYNLAFEAKLELSKQSSPNLQQWLEFGNQLRTEFQFELALDAYNFILTESNNKTIKGKALLGMAQTFENQIIPIDETHLIPYFFNQNSFFKDPFHFHSTVSKDHLESTISLYDSLLVSLPKSALLADALYRLADIQFRIIQDFDQALVLYHDALKNHPDKKLKQKINLRIADVLLAKGDANSALEFLEKILKKYSTPAIEQKRILVHFLSNEPDSTLKIVQTAFLKMNPIDPTFNDVMELKNILTQYYENDTQSASAFKHFLKAEWYIRQRKLGDAIRELDYISKTDSLSAVAPLATLREALIHYRLKDYDIALELALSLQNSTLADRGIILAGQIYETKFLNKEKALEQYMIILDSYSNSVFSEPIRYHIRILHDGES